MIKAKLFGATFAFVIFCTLPALAAPSCKPGPAQMIVIPSVHKLLKENPNYGYAQLYAIVAAFHPDLVGVEIRQEDLARPRDYLRQNYPQEMLALLDQYQDRAFGFDWLGDELTGMPVPKDWWTKQSRVKQLERAWEASPPPMDGRMQKISDKLEALSDERDGLARTASPAALANGPYDAVTAEYYRTVYMLTQNTPYALLPHWYAERDNHLADNVVAAINLHPGCRIVIVTGADHHGPIVGEIKARRITVEMVAVH